ncbi:hypothetical protein UE233_16605 [Acinetobacter oleivorans]|uniref:hypothetical protein n=1 Tax=Acinetobacter oleivorans TaxID=1148157 RepID=UPI002AAD0DE7|nr:hypothetical protein [Acinetobacter oleivorans]MDY7374240.1 hypothetical protein [Acinetobacter oleivorans]
MDIPIPVPKAFVQKLENCCMLLNELQMQGTVITGVAANQDNYDKTCLILQDLEQIDEGLDPVFQPNSLQVRFSKNQQIFYDFERLLNVPDYRRAFPCEYFYFIKDKQAFYIDEENSYFNNYKKIIELYVFFVSKADYVDGGDLIFLGNAKIIINDNYNEKDLIELPDFDNFKNKFISNVKDDSNVSLKEKEKLLKKALVSFFNNVEKISLSQLIQDFHKFHVFVNDELDLYMSKFSYEDVKDQVERDKVDFIVRLNKVFSDIQTQLIGVPVSVILAADKLKIGDAANSDPNKLLGFSMSNLLVIGAIGFYAIVISMLIRNQNNSLQALHEEIKFHKQRFETKHKGLAQKFEKSFTQLESRYSHQKRMLFWIDALVSLAFGSIFLIFIYASSTYYLYIYYLVAIILLLYGFLKLLIFFKNKIYNWFLEKFN